MHTYIPEKRDAQEKQETNLVAQVEFLERHEFGKLLGTLEDVVLRYRYKCIYIHIYICVYIHIHI